MQAKEKEMQQITTESEKVSKEELTVSAEVSKEELTVILRHHVWGAMAVGLVPIPLVDLVAIMGVQINMLRKLAKAYNIPFFKDNAKNLLSSLIGSAVPVAVAPGVAASLAKIIPIFGQTAGVITMPIIAGASTYAVGKVFIQHFASGGTFLTFDPDKVKDYYAEMLKEGEEVAAEIKKEKTSRAAKTDKANTKEKVD